MKTKAVALEDIICDERCQSRAILNQEAVQEYAEAYEADAKLPPLDVVKVGDDLLLIDGFHRLAGARQAQRGFVRVQVVETGDIDRAIWLAAAANQRHGVRRTNADKRQAVIIALQSGIGEEQSGRTIAAHCGVSHTFVQNVMAEIEAGNECQPKTEPEPPSMPDDDEPPEEPDMYHTAAARIRSCYRAVCKILGEADDVCEAVFVALEKAEEREL